MSPTHFKNEDEWRAFCATQWPQRTTAAAPSLDRSLADLVTARVHSARKGVGRIHHSAPIRIRRTR